MADDTHYQTFNLLNKEFAFDVDVSRVPCGMNAALYFVKMDADGGMAKYPTNVAGAKYGTGYCDAKCPRTPLFINGQVRYASMTSSSITLVPKKMFLLYYKDVDHNTLCKALVSPL